MPITYSFANTVSRLGTGMRAVQFYKSTRPQAPVRHKHDAALAPLVECSVCRGAFFPDTAEAKKAHRAYHEANKSDGLYYAAPCTDLVGVAHEDRYQFTTVCDDCGEDVCPCSDCNHQHGAECELWQQASKMLDEGNEAGADALADKILAAREDR